MRTPKQFIGMFVCFFKMLFRTITYKNVLIYGNWVSGCDYVLQDDNNLKCERCGFISVYKSGGK